MAGLRKCIYLNDKKVIKTLEEQDNLSSYVEQAILFYLQYKEVIPKVIDYVLAQKNKA